MKRTDFLKNALMAVAVSLLPKVLQPVQPEEEGFIGIIPYLKKYDQDKYYVKIYDDGNLVWYSGASLNYMDQWEHERRKQLYKKWMNETE